MYDRLISFVSKCDLLTEEHFRFRDGIYNELASQTIIEYSIETMLLRGIPENDFQDCFWQWHHHLMKCITSKGEYFEGDSSP